MINYSLYGDAPLANGAEQQAKLKFAELAAYIRRSSSQLGLTSLLLGSVPTILDALDLAASREPQRTA